jgi:hypothetical protein
MTKTSDFQNLNLTNLVMTISHMFTQHECRSSKPVRKRESEIASFFKYEQHSTHVDTDNFILRSMRTFKPVAALIFMWV